MIMGGVAAALVSVVIGIPSCGCVASTPLC